jgi:predicted PurR-regulated permease PerM
MSTAEVTDTMALPVRDQMRYWGIATAVFLLVLWAIGDVILPFVLGGAVAYLLDPIADRLERMGASRVVAVSIIALFTVLLVVLLFLLVIPLLVQQTTQLIATTPALFAELQSWLTAQFPNAMDAESTIRTQLLRLGQALSDSAGAILNQVLTSARSLVSIVLLFVVVPVVAFYLLLDWDRMVARFDQLLPRDHAPTIRALVAEIDRTLASFIRGQGLVCLILGTGYAVGLMAVGLNFGLVVGFVAGLISFIPYVGTLLGGVTALALALFQYWGAIPLEDGGFATDWLRIGLVAAVFGIGQFIEGNILSPKLVGNSVGLHPVWLIFALSLFGTLFGFVGLLVAVPVAAMIGVVARFLVGTYQAGRLYRGLAEDDGDPRDDPPA